MNQCRVKYHICVLVDVIYCTHDTAKLHYLQKRWHAAPPTTTILPIPMQTFSLPFAVPDRPLPFCPSLSLFLAHLRDILASQLRQRIRARENPVNLEVRVPLNSIGRVVKVRQHSVHEVGLVLRAPTRLELRQPDRTPISHSLGILNMLLERLNPKLIRIAVPMDRDEVHLAARTGTHEFLQPVQPHIPTTVAYGGAPNLDLASKLLHVIPCRGCLFGRHVGLSAEVRFVETEDVRCAVRDRLVDVGFPFGQMVIVCAPEHGHEVHAGGDVAAGGGVPVVAPADGVFLE